jgi:hypothetical protein
VATRLGPGLALVLLALTGVHAQIQTPLPNVGPPLILELDGVVEPTPDAARGKGFTTASLGFLGSEERRWLGVDKARTTGGDQPLNGKDVLAIVAPFTPNLMVVGPSDLVASLRDAPPGTKVHVEGLVDRGARTYYLRRIQLRKDKD